MKSNRILLFVMVSIFSLTGFKDTSDSILKISDNKRYFTENGKPFFWLGDTGWLLFSKLNREEADKYLEDRKLKGFNVIQVMVIHDLKRPVNFYGDSAFVNKKVSSPKVTIGNNFNDNEEYDFWDHVDYIVDLAAQKHIYMALVPFWGSNVKNGMVSRTEAEKYAEWLANRYKNRWNIIWINGGDISGSDSLEIWNIIGKTIKATDPYHLISFHPRGRMQSSDWFHNEGWLDFNMCQSGHRRYDQDDSQRKYGEDNYKYIIADYNRIPVKPTLDGEPSYEDIPQGLHDTTQPYWTNNDVRRYAYWSVLSGACGFTYGHNSVMQFYKPGDTDPAYGARKYWFDALNDAGAKEMINLKNIMINKQFYNGTPDNSIIADSIGTKYNYLPVLRSPDNILVYTYNGRNIKLKMGILKAEKVKGSWYNPRTAEIINIGTVNNNGIHEFDPPGKYENGNDWLLILEK
jgi:hypothetical protein